MSFMARDLSVLAYANGFTLWHYRTQDSLADLLESRFGRPLAGNDNGYFSPAHELLRAGDQITVNLLTRETISLVHLVVARIAGAGAVAVMPVLQIDRMADITPRAVEQPWKVIGDSRNSRQTNAPTTSPPPDTMHTDRKML